MHLWLLRHGKAVERDQWQSTDAERPLTKEGIAHARRVLNLMHGWLEVSEVWTSPMTRARQTAALAAAEWKRPLREKSWLAEGAQSPQACAHQLDAALDVVLVGHEPDLGVLAGWLCGGRPIPMKKAGLIHLEGLPHAGAMDVRAVLPPKLMLGLAGDA